ncbi:MAG: OmpA family protein [Granulosicoccaceae bacterium]|jgi:OOP family OmpA-OmpF porin
MKKNFLIPASICSLILLSGNAYALEGVVTDSDGNYVTDGFGECVSYDKLKHFHKDGGVGYCADEPKKVAEPAPKPAPPPPPPKPVIETITLGAHALFDTDKSNLRPEGMRELDDVAAKLKSFASVESITVVGHTDSVGTEAYNQGLSERRAASVRNYLVQHGIDSSVISTSGMGETSPVASNKTREGRQQNRRVEISIRATQVK